MNMTPEQFVKAWLPGASDGAVGGFNRVRTRQEQLLRDVWQSHPVEVALFFIAVCRLMEKEQPTQVDNLVLQLRGMIRKAG